MLAAFAKLRAAPDVRKEHGRRRSARVSFGMDPQRHDSWREVIPGVAILLTTIPLAVGIFMLDPVRRGIT
jgi:hypothetical protein